MSIIDTHRNMISSWAMGSDWPVLSKQEALSQAETEGLKLHLSEKNKTRYSGVTCNNPDNPKPYLARIGIYGKDVTLGSYATREQAALMFARAKAKLEAAGWMVGRGLLEVVGAEADEAESGDREL